MPPSRPIRFIAFLFTSSPRGRQLSPRARQALDVSLERINRSVQAPAEHPADAEDCEQDPEQLVLAGGTARPNASALCACADASSNRC
jgi:hypothetical protein